MTQIDRPATAFGLGAVIGMLGGLIGLFRFAALEAIILNKAMPVRQSAVVG